MSRIGNKPIEIPAGVTVTIGADNNVSVKGPKGTLEQKFSKEITIKQDAGAVTFTRPSEAKEHRAFHGLTRALLANMVTGVSTGFTKTLEVNGTGYRVAKQGKDLVMNLGFSHQVTVSEIPGITIDVPNQNTIVISGPDKQAVGQFAANVREKRPPEPYKGKGIKYSDEVIRRKEGKAGKSAKK